jgi:hypothetical protein
VTALRIALERSSGMTKKANVSQLRPHQKYERLIAADKGLLALPTAVA